jgi:tetratricopeptide (TPR) repeat protein
MPILLIVALSIVLFAALLSLSRGGSLALLAALAALSAVCAYGRLVEAKYLWSGLALSALMLGLLSLYGYEQIARRLNTLARGSMESLDNQEGRRQIWRANIAAIQAGGLLGAGAGTHSALYPVYLDASPGTEYTHAECGYLQVATENGFLGVALLFAGLGCCASWCGKCLRHARSDAELLGFGAAAAGLAASAVHSVVDFVWYIPACMSVTIVLAACVLRLSQLAVAAGESPAARVMPRGVWWGCSAASLLVGAWATHTYLGPGIAAVYWDRYLRLSASSMALNQENWHNRATSRPQSATTLKNSLNDAMFRQLESVLRWDPKFARAHLRMAAKLVTEFEGRQQNGPNRMGVAQIRDAVAASGFASATDRNAWLQVAFGADMELLRRAQAEARTAVALCPLLGEGYVELAELGFLDGDSDVVAGSYIDQAQRVRPHDAGVQFQAGHRALLNGDYASAFERWKQCFDDPGPHQLKIVYILAGRISAETLLTALEPDWRTLPIIWSRYRESAPPPELSALLKYAAEQTQRETQKPREVPIANIWLNHAGMLADAGQTGEALACLRRAYAADPRQYAVRHALAKALANAGQFAEAEPHFRWCLARHPEAKYLRDALVEISKQRIAQRDLKLNSVRGASSDGAVAPGLHDVPDTTTR